MTGPKSDAVDEDDARARAMRDAAIKGARSARPADDAEDPAHDALVELLESGRTYDDPAAVAHRAGRFRGIDHGRRAGREAQNDELGEEASTESPSSRFEDRVVGVLWARSVMAMASQELTEREFEGFMALYDRGGTINDAANYLAEKTGRDPETIRTQIRRGVAKLRAILGDDGD